jgi:hypothetical protein
MRILFVARHFTYFRNYDAALRELASRGHEIHLAVERSETIGGEQAVQALAQECPSITYGIVPDRSDDASANLARRLRLGLDYLRYLDPFYDDAPLRRVRARERTPRALIRLADPPLVGGAWWRRRLAASLHALDLAVPVPPVILDYLRAQRPDVLLITPLVDLGSQQIDFLRAARSLRIPTGLAVWSWDHLSSKAYIRECPEAVVVWNDTQRREAITVHGVPPDRIVVTGAQCFDHWFERHPSRSREEFCAQLGLPADRPIILYVCTGLIKGSPPEPPFVREWLARIRASADPRVAGAGVLVRPHPAQTRPWNGVDLTDVGPVAVWGGNPVDSQSRADYFDSLYHSAAVVGLNTSAFIEAGIVGREVLTILPPQFHDNQAGTVHFRYLMEIGGGLLRVSRDFETHLRQLSAALARPASAEHPHRMFLESFVRPGGLDTPATPAFVAAVEGLVHRPVAAAAVSRLASRSWMRTLVARLGELAASPRAANLVLSPRELNVVTRGRVADATQARQRSEEKRRRADEAREARAAKRADHERRLAEKAARMAEKRAAIALERRQSRAAAEQHDGRSGRSRV